MGSTRVHKDEGSLTQWTEIKPSSFFSSQVYITKSQGLSRVFHLTSKIYGVKLEYEVRMTCFHADFFSEKLENYPNHKAKSLWAYMARLGCPCPIAKDQVHPDI